MAQSHYNAVSAFLPFGDKDIFVLEGILALIHFMTFGPPVKSVQSLWEMVHLEPFGTNRKLLVSL